MISLTAEYALRAAVFLADPSRSSSATTSDIARQTSIPPGYLSKVLQDMARAGIVHSRRGRGGGFTLSREPAQFTVLEIVNAVDPIQRIRGCPLKLAAHAHGLCQLHRRLDDSIAAVEGIFAATSLHDLIDSAEVCSDNLRQ